MHRPAAGFLWQRRRLGEGRMENAIVDDLDVLDRMADLSSPPAAVEAAGLQKIDYFRRGRGSAENRLLSAKVWNPRELEKDDRPPPPQLSIAGQALA